MGGMKMMCICIVFIKNKGGNLDPYHRFGKMPQCHWVEPLWERTTMTIVVNPNDKDHTNSNETVMLHGICGIAIGTTIGSFAHAIDIIYDALTIFHEMGHVLQLIFAGSSSKSQHVGVWMGGHNVPIDILEFLPQVHDPKNIAVPFYFVSDRTLICSNHFPWFLVLSFLVSLVLHFIKQWLWWHFEFHANTDNGNPHVITQMFH